MLNTKIISIFPYFENSASHSGGQNLTFFAIFANFLHFFEIFARFCILFNFRNFCSLKVWTYHDQTNLMIPNKIEKSLFFVFFWNFRMILHFLKIYDTIRSKNWQMLRTNWYKNFRKGFMSYSFCKNCLLGTKGAKIAVK